MLVKMQLSLPTEARYVAMMRNVAQCVMEDIGAPVDASSDVQLAVTEACTNAVRHSDVNEYIVRINVDDALCEIEVVDLGGGFDHTPIPASDTAELEGGRGLFLMQELVDHLELVRDREGTHVKLTKRWEPQLG